MSFLIRADEEEQIRQSEEYKQYMEEHKEDNYKSTGNVQGMISEKLREYRDEDDY